MAVHISPDQSVDCEGFKVGGYFTDEPAPMLAVASGGDPDQWLGVLLHEFSHACQWAEQSPHWGAGKLGDGMWGWLSGNPVKNVAAKVAAVQAMEADCERRTVRLIREMGVPVDLERYCKAANAYLHFHNTILTTRKWYAPNRGPYEYEPVLALCNPTLDRDFSKTPPKLAKALLGCV